MKLIFKILYKKLHIYVITVLIGLAHFNYSFSQDVEPRRWSSLPLDTKIIGAGYVHSDGDVFFDPVSAIQDGKVQINGIAVSYVQPFRLGTKLARLDIKVPVAFANYEGLLNGEPAAVERDGLLDPRIRLSVNLIGPPPLKRKELLQYFGEHLINTTLGVSIAATLPLGQYSEDYLINLGQNRFIFRPQIGLLHNHKLWSYEVTGSVYLYTDNSEFFNGQLRQQKPTFTLQTHVIKRFHSRLWASISAALGDGGESEIDNISKNDKRTDFVGALSTGYALSSKQGLKLAFVYYKALADVGSDINTLLLGWSIQL